MYTFRRLLSTVLILCTLGMHVPARAAMLATDAAYNPAAREAVLGALERADVRARLEALGARPQDVKARVQALSDDEVAQLAADMERLPAGGDSIVGAIVLIFLVLLLTDILGFTKIFPFTRSVR